MIRVGNPGYYQPCLEKPDFLKFSVEKPQFIKPEIERPNYQAHAPVRPEFVKPNIVMPEIVKPIVERPEYDNRCDQYVATSLLKGGLNLNYSESGVAKIDLGPRSVALAQQMIAKVDSAKAKGNAGFILVPREVAKLNSSSEECTCGNGVNIASTPVIVRR